MSRRFGLVLVALLLAAAAPAGARAAGWTHPAGFRADPPTPEDSTAAAPRVGIAADGTAVVAYRHSTGRGQAAARDLRAAAGGSSGAFAAPRVLTRGAVSSFSAAAAPGGQRLVAWVGPGGVRAAHFERGRWTVRRLSNALRSAIDTVQVAADPRGGWVLAVTRFQSPNTEVQALDLTQDGGLAGPVHELGDGDFGDEARPVFALAVDARGTAVVAYRGTSSGDAARGVFALVRARPHGGTWSAATALAGLTDARVTPDPAGGAVLAATRQVRRGDAGHFGGPVTAWVRPDGTVSAPLGPVLAQPGRAFTPSAVGLGGGRRLLVGSLRTSPAAFSPVAPVAATLVRAGGSLRGPALLTPRLASEPVAVPLAGGRAFVLWAGERGWGAASVTALGSMGYATSPPGPPPVRFHFNDTNRDVRSAGGRVAVAWERGGRVRVSVRRP